MVFLICFSYFFQICFFDGFQYCRQLFQTLIEKQIKIIKREKTLKHEKNVEFLQRQKLKHRQEYKSSKHLLYILYKILHIQTIQKAQMIEQPEKEARSHRNRYEVTQVANYKFYNKCKCLLSEPLKFVGTQALIFIGAALYYSVTAPYQHVSLIVLSVIAHLVVLVISGVLAFRDPGTLRKILPKYEDPELHQIPINDRYLSQYMRDVRKSYTFVSKTHALRLKFCGECYIYRPPRTSHCYECGICVERFDHHCPWIGTCIGKNNYKFYFSFILGLGVWLGLLIGQSIYAGVLSAENGEIVYTVFNSILCLLCFLSEIFVLVLICLHSYFIKLNVTTNQYCKDTWETISGNPFTKTACVKNILKIFGTPAVEKSDPHGKLKKREDLMKIDETLVKINTEEKNKKSTHSSDSQQECQEKTIQEDDIQLDIDQGNS